MKAFKVAIIEQSEGIAHLYPCIAYNDTAQELFSTIVGKTLVDAINRDMEYRLIYPPVEFEMPASYDLDKGNFVAFDPTGSLRSTGRSTAGEMVVLPFPDKEDHYILFFNNMKIIYKNLRGSLSRNPINLLAALNSTTESGTSAFSALEHFDDIVRIVHEHELL